MSTCSLVTPNLVSSNPKSLNHPFFSKYISSNLTSCVSNASFGPLSLKRVKSLNFVRRVVAVSSEYEHSEEEEVRFSEDLKIFVGNLPFTVDSSELAGLFGSVGTVEMVEVIYEKTTGRSKGFGFVTMSSVEEVEAAVQQLNGSEFQGRTLRVNSGPPPPKEDRAPRGSFGNGGGYRNEGEFRSGGGYRNEGGFRNESGFRNEGGFRSGGGGSFSSGNRLYVGNLSWGVDTATLENLFGEQGKVMDAKVVLDRDSGRSRGFGFVTYNTAEEARNAISSFDGYDLDGRTIRVSVAEERPQRQF